MLRPFELHRPATADEACSLLTRLGDDAVPYAGGTELLLLMKLGMLRPRHLVDVKRIAGFDAIVEDAGAIDARGVRQALPANRLSIGATVTHRSVERSPLVRHRAPLLAEVARHVANVRVRNVGTVGGNLAFADPHSDLATLFLTMNASVELVSPRGRREMALADFIRGPWETAREPGELLASVRLTTWAPGTGAAYVKFGVYERPTLGVAVVLGLDGGPAHARITDARIAVGCVSPRPARVSDAERLLNTVTLDAIDDVIARAADLAAASADPDDDVHGSADYKREMVAVFVRRAIRIAAARARGVEAATRFPYAVVA